MIICRTASDCLGSHLQTLRDYSKRGEGVWTLGLCDRLCILSQRRIPGGLRRQPQSHTLQSSWIWGKLINTLLFYLRISTFFSDYKVSFVIVMGRFRFCRMSILRFLCGEMTILSGVAWCSLCRPIPSFYQWLHNVFNKRGKCFCKQTLSKTYGWILITLPNLTWKFFLSRVWKPPINGEVTRGPQIGFTCLILDWKLSCGVCTYQVTDVWQINKQIKLASYKWQKNRQLESEG